MRAHLLETLTPLVVERTSVPLERLRLLWPLLLRDALSRQSRPVRLQRDSLIVEVSSPAVAQELSMASTRLLRRLGTQAAALELPRISRVVSRVAARGTFPTPAPEPLEKPRPKQPLPEGVERALTGVEDDDLRNRLTRMAERATSSTGDEGETS